MSLCKTTLPTDDAIKTMLPLTFLMWGMASLVRMSGDMKFKVWIFCAISVDTSATVLVAGSEIPALLTRTSSP